MACMARAPGGGGGGGGEFVRSCDVTCYGSSTTFKCKQVR